MSLLWETKQSAMTYCEGPRLVMGYYQRKVHFETKTRGSKLVIMLICFHPHRSGIVDMFSYP